MVKEKIKKRDISEFLNSWDKKIDDLNLEVKKINLKQKKDRDTLRQKEGLTYILQN